MTDDGTRLKRWKFTGIPNFDEVSQSTAEIKLLTVSENGRSPCWISISGFLPNLRQRCVILHWPTKSCQNRTTRSKVMTSYRFFFKMAACSHIGFDLDNIRPPTKCNCWCVIGPQMWSSSDLSLRRYCDFYILPFWLEIAYSRSLFTYYATKAAHDNSIQNI